jgi:leader peptidase (prepilin peptidase) / N-methyltransferase
VPDSSSVGVWAVLLCGVFGLLIGSFLNVVIARVPDGVSVVRPGSRCPVCETPIAPRDNLPVLSWLLLRGRARCCGTRISARYPVIEAGTAVAFVAVAAWSVTAAPTPWALPAFGYLAAVSIALAVIDLDTFRLPFSIVAPSYPVAAALLGAASWAEHDLSSAVRMLGGAAVMWGLYRLLHLIYPPGMGYGDVRLSGVLGLYLGWLGWGELAVGTFMGFLTGGLVGLGLVVIGRSKLKSHIPYGPYLLTGAWIGVFAGHPISTWYLHGMGL